MNATIAHGNPSPRASSPDSQAASEWDFLIKPHVPGPWMKAPKAAAVLGCGASFVYSLIAEGRLSAQAPEGRQKKRYTILTRSVRDYLAATALYEPRRVMADVMAVLDQLGSAEVREVVSILKEPDGEDGACQAKRHLLGSFSDSLWLSPLDASAITRLPRPAIYTAIEAGELLAHQFSHGGRAVYRILPISVACLRVDREAKGKAATASVRALVACLTVEQRAEIGNRIAATRRGIA